MRLGWKERRLEGPSGTLRVTAPPDVPLLSAQEKNELRNATADELVAHFQKKGFLAEVAIYAKGPS
jgi:hypothetical protein